MTQKFKLLIGVLGLCCGALFLFQPVNSTSNTFSIPWYSLDGGGRRSQNSVFEIAGSTGQPDAGELSGNGFTLNGGFWHTPFELLPEDESAPPLESSIYLPMVNN